MTAYRNLPPFTDATRRVVALAIAGCLHAPLTPAATAAAASPSGAVAPATHVESDELSARIPDTFALAAAHYDFLLGRIKSGAAQPRTYVDGTLKLVGAIAWTSGVFPGSLWFLYEYTGDAK